MRARERAAHVDTSRTHISLYNVVCGVRDVVVVVVLPEGAAEATLIGSTSADVEPEDIRNRTILLIEVRRRRACC